jgi:hypothetical protein
LRKHKTIFSVGTTDALTRTLVGRLRGVAVTGVAALYVLPLTAQEGYFQQAVAYVIDVRLDDTKHSLDGRIDIVYVNHSPDTLCSIYFHLWANAFSRRHTAFDQQQLRQGNTAYHFAEEAERGGYRRLSFAVEGTHSAIVINARDPDIGVLALPAPLHPGDSVRIAVDFELRIPASFSRLGRAEGAYQLTQWYPKPAVYDLDGWQVMPYLGVGEFYAELGDYDVSITLPADYVVGATGVLRTPEGSARAISRASRRRRHAFENAALYGGSRARLRLVRG